MNRSFLKWAGGKSRCLQHILPLLPAGKKLIEPFVGSAIIFLNTNYNAYTLSDNNADLIHLLSFVQKKGPSFIKYCKQYFSPKNNQPDVYYRLRKEFNTSQNLMEKAALFLYLNRHGYNGLCRYNQSGLYNVPFGRYIKPYFPEKELNYFHHKSKNTRISTQSFEQTFEKARVGDVIYCDPPYAPFDEQKTNFSSYTAQGFHVDHQIRLRELAETTASRGIPVIISNHDTAFTRKQYQNACIYPIQVQRNISRLGQYRKPAKELVAVFR